MKYVSIRMPDPTPLGELPEPPPSAWKNASGSPSLSPYGPPAAQDVGLFSGGDRNLLNFHIRSHLGPVVLQ